MGRDPAEIFTMDLTRPQRQIVRLLGMSRAYSG